MFIAKIIVVTVIIKPCVNCVMAIVINNNDTTEIVKEETQNKGDEILPPVQLDFLL